MSGDPNGIYNLHKETLTKNEQVPAQNLSGSEQFGIVPKGVMAMPDVTPAGKLVLAGMGLIAKGETIVAASCAYIAATCGLSRMCVASALHQLELKRMIRRSGEPVGQVQPYEILHSRLLTAGKAPKKPEVKTASGRIKPKLALCVCGSLKLLGSAGRCRKCMRKMEIEQTARRVAREEIAKSAG